MTVAYDTVTLPGAWTTADPFTFTHTPVGTPRAILVAIAANVDDDEIDGVVSYGGQALTRVGYQPLAGPTDACGCWLYFLGSGIPTGAQTVSIDHTGVASSKWATSVTLTAASDTVIVDSDAYVSAVATAVSLTLDSGADDAFRIACLISEANSPGVITDGGGQTRVGDRDFGAQSSVVSRRTAIESGSTSITYSTQNVASAMVAVAVAEGSGGTTIEEDIFDTFDLVDQGEGTVANPTDPFVLSDDVVWSLEKIIADNLDISDQADTSVIAIIDVEIVDDFDIGDTLETSVTLDAVVIDGFDLNDITALAQIIHAETVDGLQLADALDTELNIETVFTDDLELTDVVDVTLSAIIDVEISDDFGFVDSVDEEVSGGEDILAEYELAPEADVAMPFVAVTDQTATFGFATENDLARPFVAYGPDGPGGGQAAAQCFRYWYWYR